MSAISPAVRSWTQRSGLTASCGPVQLVGLRSKRGSWGVGRLMVLRFLRSEAMAVPKLDQSRCATAQPARWNSRGATCRRKPLCSASRACHAAIFGIDGRSRSNISHR